MRSRTLSGKGFSRGLLVRRVNTSGSATWSSLLGSKTSICGRRTRCGEIITSEIASNHETEETLTKFKHSEYYDPTRVGTLLIILNRGYMGGEIIIGCRNKEVLFDPASAKQEHFYIAR